MELGLRQVVQMQVPRTEAAAEPESPPASQGVVDIEGSYESDSSLPSSQEPAVRRASQMHLATIRLPLKQFIHKTGLTGFHFPRFWQFLERKTKRRRTHKTRELLSKVIETVSPDGAAELQKTLLKPPGEGFWLEGIETQPVTALLGTIADAYGAAESRPQRLQLLSLVATMFPLVVLQEYIPGLTPYMFTEARYHASLVGLGRYTEEPKRTLGKCSMKSLWTALNFITSDLVSMPAPFGTKKMRLSSGDVQEVDLFIRHQSQEHTYQLYKKYMEEIQQQSDLLSRSLFLKILQKCPATKRHSVHGLDTYTFAGLEAVDSLMNELTNWHQSGLARKDWADAKKMELQNVKMYLRSDYKVHVNDASEVSDHCSTWALSDHSNTELQSTCNHNHNFQCPRCEQIEQVISDIRDFVNMAQFSSVANKDEATFLTDKAVESIQAWKQHQLRTVHQDQARTETWDNLKDTEIFIILDYAMKWLPTAGRESQQGWFGTFRPATRH